MILGLKLCDVANKILRKASSQGYTRLISSIEGDVTGNYVITPMNLSMTERWVTRSLTQVVGDNLMAKKANFFFNSVGDRVTEAPTK